MSDDLRVNATEATRTQKSTARAGRRKRPITSKKARLETLLRRSKGATMPQLERSLGWQPHTIRAAISRLRKSGFEIVLDQGGKTPIYRIEGVT